MQRRFTNKSNLKISLKKKKKTPFSPPSALTMDLGAMLGFWANAGFFMSAGLVGFGDMVAGWASKDVSPFPSEICSRGTPANS